MNKEGREEGREDRREAGWETVLLKVLHQLPGSWDNLLREEKQHRLVTLGTCISLSKSDAGKNKVTS